MKKYSKFMRKTLKMMCHPEALHAVHLKYRLIKSHLKMMRSKKFLKVRWFKMIHLKKK